MDLRQHFLHSILTWSSYTSWGHKLKFLLWRPMFYISSGSASNLCFYSWKFEIGLTMFSLLAILLIFLLVLFKFPLSYSGSTSTSTERSLSPSSICVMRNFCTNGFFSKITSSLWEASFIWWNSRYEKRLKRERCR